MLDFERPILELDSLISELKLIAQDPEARRTAELNGTDVDGQIQNIEKAREEMLRRIYSNLTPWDEVQIARHKDRPYTLDYIRLICEDFLELHGDHTHADDPAIVGGIAKFQGHPVVALGHQKGRDLKERQLRNFGSARPSGFRKALRLMKMAEKFNRPILIFVDTPAAEAGLQAEEEGISLTIATCLREMAMLTVPVIVTVIGEGGSGGALGIAIGNNVMMLEHAVYSVIPPEGCAAILWNDRTRAAEAAEALKLTAKHALEYELIDEVLPEPLGGAHRDPHKMAATLKEAISRRLSALLPLSPEELTTARYQKLRSIGRWFDENAGTSELRYEDLV